jgi:DNA-binding MarR family transcriptional regulator
MPDSNPRPSVLMFIAHRAVEMRALEALTEAGFDDITLAQMRLMQRLNPAGMRLTDLAASAMVTKQSAGELVDQLEQAGFVQREPDPTDGRARLITATDKAWQRAKIAEAAVDAVERTWRKHLGAKAYAEMRRSLVKLRVITDPYA